jgi:holo-[acyl-carrier protein] synthase
MTEPTTPASSEANIVRLASVVAAGVNHDVRHRIGIDLVDIAMLKRQVHASLGSAFIDRLFSPDEASDSRGRVERLATRWAVKEAVAKAIGTGFRSGLRPLDVAVMTAPNGDVSVRPAEGAIWPRGASTWEWSVSASHEGNWAIAIALAVAANDLGVTEEGPHE